MSSRLGDSLKLLGDLRAKIEKMKEEAGAIRVEGSAGGGMVKVIANAKLEILSVQIEPGILNPGERELVQDLVASAVTSAISKAQTEMRNKLGVELMALGVPLPDLSGLVN
ncbi:MAG: YbaB/EbfC family nucleoid-associated protein [bacterium]